MNKEKQRIKIAEACGYCFEDGRNPITPDYLNDLNAIREAVISTGAYFIKAFDGALIDFAVRRCKFICGLDATEWSEVFLRTLSLWEDGE